MRVSKIAAHRIVLFFVDSIRFAPEQPLSKIWARWATIILLAIAWLTESPLRWERMVGFPLLIVHTPAVFLFSPPFPFIVRSLPVTSQSSFETSLSHQPFWAERIIFI